MAGGVEEAGAGGQPESLVCVGQPLGVEGVTKPDRIRWHHHDPATDIAVDRTVAVAEFGGHRNAHADPDGFGTRGPGTA